MEYKTKQSEKEVLNMFGEPFVIAIEYGDWALVLRQKTPYDD